MSTDKFKDKKFIDINGLTHFYDNLKETELSKYILNEDIILATDDDIINIYYANEYLTFEVLNDSSFSFSNDGIQYSIDKTNWNTLSANQSTPVFNSGTKVYWKGDLEPNSSNGIGTFSSTGNFNVYGNPKKLLKDNELVNYSFYKLFYNCTNLTNASELILDATTLADYCYYNMFYSCTSLTEAPELPATTLANYCYQYMFKGCTSLTEAPELPATTLVSFCYSYMFEGCTGLTQAPELPATSLANDCYGMMFRNCTSLTQTPELPATTLVSGCYSYMFQGCTSLTEAPELPATTLAGSCYANMFNGCTSLTQAPELPATKILVTSYSSMFNGCSKLNKVICYATTGIGGYNTRSWLSGVSDTGDFYKVKDVTYPSGVSGIPSSWTVHNIEE